MGLLSMEIVNYPRLKAFSRRLFFMMMKRFRQFVFIIALWLLPALMETTIARTTEKWLNKIPIFLKLEGAWFDELSSRLPFSFYYKGKFSADFLPTWEVSRKSNKLDQQRTEHKITFPIF